MNGTIFGIGPLEVIVVLVLTLLIFGPERLPELTRGMGNALRKIRLTYIAFTQEFQGELQPIAEDIDSVTREIRQEVDAIREAADLRSLLKPYAEDVNKAIALQPIAPQVTAQTFTSTTTPSTTATSNGANTIAPPATATATSKPPATGGKPATNGTAKTYAARSATPSTPTPIYLPEDNPWASVGAAVRSDKLDDDSPWRS